MAPSCSAPTWCRRASAGGTRADPGSQPPPPCAVLRESASLCRLSPAVCRQWQWQGAPPSVKDSLAGGEVRGQQTGTETQREKGSGRTAAPSHSGPVPRVQGPSGTSRLQAYVSETGCRRRAGGSVQLDGPIQDVGRPPQRLRSQSSCGVRDCGALGRESRSDQRPRSQAPEGRPSRSWPGRPGLVAAGAGLAPGGRPRHQRVCVHGQPGCLGVDSRKPLHRLEPSAAPAVCVQVGVLGWPPAPLRPVGPPSRPWPRPLCWERGPEPLEAAVWPRSRVDPQPACGPGSPAAAWRALPAAPSPPTRPRPLQSSPSDGRLRKTGPRPCADTEPWAVLWDPLSVARE